MFQFKRRDKLNVGTAWRTARVAAVLHNETLNDLWEVGVEMRTERPAQRIPPRTNARFEIDQE